MLNSHYQSELNQLRRLADEFARRNPALAERFREALRDAKDRNSMLAASRDMIDEIEKAAGHERADSISERLAMLLPSEAAADLAA